MILLTCKVNTLVIEIYEIRVMARYEWAVAVAQTVLFKIYFKNVSFFSLIILRCVNDNSFNRNYLFSFRTPSAKNYGLV